MNRVQIIREMLETHKIETDSDEISYLSPRLTQKCAGCHWVGFDHLLHVAKVIDARLSEVDKEFVAKMLSHAIVAPDQQ